jgi:hypothetical protein
LQECLEEDYAPTAARAGRPDDSNGRQKLQSPVATSKSLPSPAGCIQRADHGYRHQQHNCSNQSVNNHDPLLKIRAGELQADGQRQQPLFSKSYAKTNMQNGRQMRTIVRRFARQTGTKTKCSVPRLLGLYRSDFQLLLNRIEPSPV